MTKFYIYFALALIALASFLIGLTVKQQEQIRCLKSSVGYPTLNHCFK